MDIDNDGPAQERHPAEPGPVPGARPGSAPEAHPDPAPGPPPNPAPEAQPVAAREAHPEPRWDPTTQQWTAEGHRWDAATQRWVPLTPVAPTAVVAPPRPPEPRRRLGRGALIAIVGGGVAVVAVIAVVAGLLVVGSRPSTAEQAASVVRTYLTALAGSDAETALDQLAERPGATTLLTDDVLRVSNEKSPIADISVTVPDHVGTGALSVRVPVSYSVGDRNVTTTLSVSDYADSGRFSIEHGTTTISRPFGTDGLDLTVDGTAVDDDEFEVFPGTYEVATTSEDFTLSGGTTLTLSSPDDYQSFHDVHAGLSETGLSTFRSLVTEAVNACVSSTTLAAGCGLDLPETLDDGTKVIEGSIHRSLDAEGQSKLASPEPEESVGDPRQVRGPHFGLLHVTADCESDGKRYPGCELYTYHGLGRPLVDFTVSPPVVRWD